MKILILGAAGQIGTVIHKSLTHYETIGTSRAERKGCIRFDPFRDNWSVLGKVDILINCVGIIDPDKSTTFHDIHVRLIEEIITNRAAIGGPRIVQISALGASSKHPTEFLRTKGMGDDLLMREPNTIIMRPSIICTPGTMIVRKLRTLRRLIGFTFGLIFVPAGFLQTRIQPVMPQDLADVVEAVCKQEILTVEKILNVVGPNELTFRELLNIFLESTFLTSRLIEIPRKFMDPIVNLIVTPLFRRQLNHQQYQLLFEDNIADTRAIIRLLKRPLLPTAEFFKKESRR